MCAVRRNKTSDSGSHIALHHSQANIGSPETGRKSGRTLPPPRTRKWRCERRRWWTLLGGKHEGLRTHGTYITTRAAHAHHTHIND
jgi:hypothetical protein